MLGLVGPRGVGKTTMFLQYIKEHQSEQNMLYVSADYVYFSSHTLIDLADEFSREGGEYLFIDEIHKYSGWAQELKQIYDTHVDLKVAFTGSSVLDIILRETIASNFFSLRLVESVIFANCGISTSIVRLTLWFNNIINSTSPQPIKEEG